MNVLEELKSYYDGFTGEKGILTHTINGNPIYYFAVKKSPKPIIIAQYAIHAREYITTYLALKQIEAFRKSGRWGTVYFIPAMNPDGIRIAITCDTLYKANGRGVDLNVNFDAHWGMGEKNVFTVGRENYVGEKPFSEKETAALRDFTLKVCPDITVSYHSKGEEIYYDFFGKDDTLKKSFKAAQAVAKVTGYAVRSPIGSAGGYKDWCIESLDIPALTIEVGKDSLSHPLKKDSLKQIYNKNRQVLFALTEKEGIQWN